MKREAGDHETALLQKTHVFRNLTQDLLKKLYWTVFNHPPYSPDIAPNDYHFFPFLKTHLGGRWFEANEEVAKEVTNWLQINSTEFYALGIEKLVNRYDKCLDRLSY